MMISNCLVELKLETIPLYFEDREVESNNNNNYCPNKTLKGTQNSLFDLCQCIESVIYSKLFSHSK